MENRIMSYSGTKDCLREATLGGKSFGKYNKDQEFYTFIDN